MPAMPDPAAHSTAAPPAVDAATVVLVRDGDDGALQVCLLERHIDSDFAGGAFVFPGGKVDVQDRELPAARHRGADLAEWQPLLGAPDRATTLGLLAAAVRECFEEAGVLLARDEHGRRLTADVLARPSFVDARRRLASRDERFDWRPWLEAEGLVLDLGALALWSWWVTPEGQHKRFDTRFLVAALPPTQQAAEDEVETTSLRWLSPQQALDAHAAGEVNVIYPTRRNLRDLATFPTVDRLLAAAREGRVDQRRIQPTVVRVDGQVMVQHPDGDAPEVI
ncbi:MAG: NUDIX domain-containing protein [Nitriliruptoraceae bacterium]|nr:NUDIX domain-containing protein [Nitriliruptoraceae bacterium]